jgi:hypothetical protein
MKCETEQFDDVVTSYISALIVDYFTPDGFQSNYLDQPCLNSTQKLLKELHSTFVDVVKHSEIKSSLNTEVSRTEFQEKYFNSLMIALHPLNIPAPVKPLYLMDRVEMIHFCDFETKQGDLSNSLENNCNLFQPFLTPKGLCFTFNSLSMKEIFQPTDNLHHWDSVLGFKNKSILVQPSGSSQVNGFRLILNSFEQYDLKTSRTNFILSITNEHNPFDIIHRNYLIEPGYSYTFSVLANQMISSSVLNKMEPNDRKCHFAYESKLINITKLYSKSSCEYECLIRNTVKDCQCIPWNMPELHTENMTYCEYLNTDCFAILNNTFSTVDCNCPSDCEETSFSVIKSNQILEYEYGFCSDERFNTNFPNSIFCGLCRKIIKEQRIRFVYEHIVNNGPDPNDLDKFCQKFVTENVALIEVEMATKTLIRSIKTKRFKFVDQLSSLGITISIFFDVPHFATINFFFFYCTKWPTLLHFRQAYLQSQG